MSTEPPPRTYLAPRLFVESALVAGEAVPLPRDQARYLMTVMRRERGAVVRLFNGRDGEWAARLEVFGRDKAALAPERLIRPQPAAAGPWLMFAALKRGPTELIVEKATELGASRLIPVRTERVNAERLNTERLARIAREASEQSERLDVPAIDDIRPLTAVLAEWPADRTLVVGDETGAAPPVLQAVAASTPTGFGLLIGPEGGFAQGELDALDQFEFVRKVGLGPRVLRAETAAITALAIAQAVWGDLAAARTASE